MVWREEEILATELMAQALGCGQNFYILSRGRQKDTVETALRLVTRPDMKKVYPSFPMSHVVDMPDVLAEIDHFRAELAKHFITFDPGDVDEKLLLDRGIEAARQGKDFVEVEAHSFGGRGGGPPPRGPRNMPPEMREMFERRMHEGRERMEKAREEMKERMEKAREKFQQLEDRVKALEAEVERLKATK